jgi:hypothetical protein
MMSPLGLHSSDELIRFVEAAGESGNIEAKGPMEWDRGEESAGLTKDILAHANSQDGGVIVLGKGQSQGKFVLIGLSEAQAASFETTKVATWVNNHCSPPVNIVCYHTNYQGRRFVVIAISEFHDVPVVCTKEYEIPSAGKTKVVLRKGFVYVRTANAASEPLSTVEDMRQLMGLATKKQGNKMLAMFQAMLKGQPLLAEMPHEEFFEAEKQEVQNALDSELQGQARLGAWTFLGHPAQHVPTRWEETDTLREILKKCVVRVQDQDFPPISYGTHVREWGICNTKSEDAFGLTRSGLFLSTRLFRENAFPCKARWQSHTDLPAGQWLDYKRNVSLLIEFFMFLSRFAENLDVGSEVVFAVTAAPLTGRQLASVDPNIWFDYTIPCRANRFCRSKVVAVETLRTSW